MRPQYLDRERGWVARKFFIKLYSSGLLIRLGNVEINLYRPSYKFRVEVY